MPRTASLLLLSVLAASGGLSGQEVDRAFLVGPLRPFGIVGVPYSDLLAAETEGGATWSLHPASPPPRGLILDPRTGIVTGTPVDTGLTIYNVQVLEGTHRTVSMGFWIWVHDTLRFGVGDTLVLVAGLDTRVPLASGQGNPVDLQLIEGNWPPGMRWTEFGELIGVPVRTSVETHTTVIFDVTEGSLTRRRTIHFLTIADLPRVDPRWLEYLGATSFGTSINLAMGSPADWRVLEGRLPDGLVLYPSGRLIGQVTELGDFVAVVQGTRGQLAGPETTIEMRVSAPDVTPSQLRDAILGTDVLSWARARYLDLVGNDNGVFDLGDARAWMIAQGLLTASGGRP